MLRGMIPSDALDFSLPRYPTRLKPFTDRPEKFSVLDNQNRIPFGLGQFDPVPCWPPSGPGFAQ